MWKYVVIWSIYTMTTMYNNQTRSTMPMFVKAGQDTAIFNDRDSAISFVANSENYYYNPPHGRKGKAFDFRLDSIFIETERKGAIFIPSRKKKVKNIKHATIQKKAGSH